MLFTLDVVSKHISLNLAEKSAQHMLDLKALAEDCNVEGTLPSSIIVLNQTNQLKAMTTIIRDKDAESEDFIFYLERTSSLVLERYLSLQHSPDRRALDELPYKQKDIETPGGHLYKGLELSAKICAVEIVRAGGAMRTSFSRIFADAPIGKVLIQTSEVGEPLVSPLP
jgi:uracil phosphoribosyltransferase